MVLGRIKRLLGLGDPREEDDPDQSSTTVSVEHDPDDPQLSTEEAVKGTDMESDDSIAAGTDAAASTGSLTDEGSTDKPAEAAEPAEAAGPGTDDIEPNPATDGQATGEAAADTDSDDPVDTVTGIGPAYAERLNEIGIETTADLADANAEKVAAQISVSESRVERWISRARDEDA